MVKLNLDDDKILSCLLRVTTECFAVLDMDGHFLDVNQAFCTLVGYSREEILQKEIFDLHASPPEISLQSQWKTICQRDVMDFKFCLNNMGGRKLRLVGNFFNHNNGSNSFVCIFCKLEPPKPEEVQLLKLRTQALETAANAVVITTHDGKVVWANRAFSKYTGYSMEEVLGQSPGEFLKSGRHPAEFYQEMWKTISRGDVWQGEILNRRKDGSIYPEEMTITPIYSKDGEITHYIAIKQDVSEKKDLQKMFLRAQRLESVGALASGVAHDLNNVLSPIVMSADLLMVQIEDENTLELLQMIKEGAKRGADIVRQLLTFVRGDQDEMTELQLRHLLKDIVKVFRETFPKYITIENRISSNLPTVFGNATNLHQVFTNLMINARDAMPDGGNLLIEVNSVTLSDKEAEQFSYARAGDFIKVRIQDKGTGIPPEMQEVIFESFFTTKEHGKGTGLGLPTTLTIIKKHHGFIELKSEEGVGSTFDVYLPVFSGEGASPTSVKPADSILLGNGEHLLVIDDEESIGFMLKGTLKSLNYEVSIVNNGVEGLRWWKANRDSVDLILLDMMMPIMDGAEVCQELQKENCEAKVLIMSGMVSEDRLLDTGIDLTRGFIAKPFTIADLSKKLRGLLESNEEE